jgi:radical SAM protein with 4Fe4S-binding SPASM domain
MPSPIFLDKAFLMNMPQKISFMYEVSGGCNQSCTFCYNTWRKDDCTPKGQLGTRETLNLLGKVISETKCDSISLSGGEPLLRGDIFEIISYIKKNGVKVNLISNGLSMTEEVVDRCVSSGVDLFQVTLLCDRPELHHRLTGVDGFSAVLDAILNIKKKNGTVYTFFVGLADNIRSFRKTLELNVLLGVSTVALGRFIPGGAGFDGWEKFLPSPEMIDKALEIGDEMCRKYPLSISISTPILPCLNDISRYKNIRFGFCGTCNKVHSVFGIDPEGNLKVCSHSPHLLGNLLEEPFERLIDNSFIGDFSGTVPAFCRDCPDLPHCRGGCRSSANVCSGSFDAEDPYLEHWKSRARKPAVPTFDGCGPESGIETC